MIFISKIHIGIDCRPLIGKKTGIGYYLWEILDNWAQNDYEMYLYLYSSRDFILPQSFNIKHKNFRFVKRIFNVKPSEIWMHTILPIQISKDPIDVFWGPNYAMPYLNIKKIPIVITIHDLVYKKFPETMKKITYLHNKYGLERYIKKCNKIIVPSKNTKRDLIELLHVSEDKIHVVPLGASNRFDFKREDNKDIILNKFKLESEQYIFVVGTLEPRKNLRRIIDAYELIKSDFTNIKIAIAGSKGWGNVELVGEDVNYLGYVDEDELVTLYQNCKFFVYIPLYEGFGLPPLEAMKCGVPVITSNISSLPEVVGDAAIKVNPENITEISKAMKLLWNDDILRNKMKIKSIQQAQYFSWELTAKKTLQLLENTISTRKIGC